MRTSPDIFFGNVRVICFDLWQTIADSMCKPSDLYYRYHHWFRVDVVEYRKRFRFADIYTRPTNIETALSTFLDDTGAFSLDAKQAFIHEWMRDVSIGRVLDAAVKVIPLLASRGYKLVLMSNTDAHAFSCLEWRSLMNYFDYRVLSFEVGFSKPDPRCWELVRERFKVTWGEMLMVGDDFLTDIKPAGLLGLQTYHICQSDELFALADLLSGVSDCITAN